MSADHTPMPVRILVKGASTVTWTSWMGGPRTEFAYPRVVEQQLRSKGYDVDSRVTAMSAERARSLLRTWERDVSGFSPDVIVLHYGHMETIHAIIPRWVERHARGLRDRPGPVRERYRRLVVRPVWKLLAQVQKHVDLRLPARALAHRPARVSAILERWIRHAQKFQHPLVVVMGLTSPGRAWDDWFPGVGPRLEAMEAELQALVERLDDPDVVFLPVWDDAEEWDARGEDPRLDGAHYTPAFHRHVGEKLAARVEAWVATQPHLRLPD